MHACETSKCPRAIYVLYFTEKSQMMDNPVKYIEMMTKIVNFITFRLWSFW